MRGAVCFMEGRDARVRCNDCVRGQRLGAAAMMRCSHGSAEGKHQEKATQTVYCPLLYMTEV